MKVGEWSWSYRAATVPTDNLSLALYMVYALYHSPNVNRLKYVQDCIWASACQTAKKKKRKEKKTNPPTIPLNIFLLAQFPNCTFGVTE